MSLYQTQKETKPKIEDVAGNFLYWKHLKGLNDFLAFLKENKLTPRWMSGNSWTIKYKSKTICFVKIVGTSWLIMFSSFTREKWFVGYDDYFDDGLKEFVWENVKDAWCPRDCKGKKRTIFGKEFTDICGCWAIRAENPDGAALESAKKVILATKAFISDLPTG